jgi:hypothetical protein
VAQQIPPGAAMTVMAAASVAVTLVLAPGLRPERPEECRGTGGEVLGEAPYGAGGEAPGKAIRAGGMDDLTRG